MADMNNIHYFDLTTKTTDFEKLQYKVYTVNSIDRIPYFKELDEHTKFETRVVANVLPFRVNNYVIDHLIDWSNIPDDPIFQLTFPQKAMLAPEHFDYMAKLLKQNADRKTVAKAAAEIHCDLNPHPADQGTLNVPQINNQAIEGLQHKYNETVLFFPNQGQICHAYCTFCFRWPQFVATAEDLKFAAKENAQLLSYLKAHKEVSDLLVTGGDPMVMKTRRLESMLEPLLHKEFEHIRTIRFGSKALTFWPYRFVTDADADDLLRLFERLVKAGKHVAFMAHFNHWRELDTPVAKEAIRRIRDTGAVIRSQAPLLKHINDDAQVWSSLWQKQVELGLTPYYMFVERDTGARRYFEVPLAQAWEIYSRAIRSVSGLARTVRGPSMSAGPGKVEIQGITEINGEQVFVLRFIQGRNADWVQNPFFARYDEQATWLNHLKPAFGQDKFFFEHEYELMKKR